jgi:hypothetical protein
MNGKRDNINYLELIRNAIVQIEECLKGYSE